MSSWQSSLPRRLTAAGAVLFVLCAAGLLWRAHSRGARTVALLTQMHEALDTDSVQGYRQVLALADEVFALREGQVDARGMVAYAATILAIEHHEPQMAKRAKRMLITLAHSPQNGTQTALSASMVTSARALMVWADGDPQQGRAELVALGEPTLVTAYPALEAQRLRVASHLPATELTAGFNQLQATVTREARVWAYLGQAALAAGDVVGAGRQFAAALAHSPQHVGAKLGLMWLRLDGSLSRPDHKSLNELAGALDTLLTNDQALSPPERSQALAVRARVRHLEGDDEGAQKDLAEARQLDSTNIFVALPEAWAQDKATQP